MRVSARLATRDRPTAFGIFARQIRRKVKVQQLGRQRTAIRDFRARTNGRNFERACPEQRKLSFEDRVVGAKPNTWRVVDSELYNQTQPPIVHTWSS